MVVGWACFFTLESLPLKTREKKDILTEMRPRIGFARQESGCGGRSRGSAFFFLLSTQDELEIPTIAGRQTDC